MISFFISIAALVLGYMLYGRFVERVFGLDGREAPSLRKADGVDFVAMPTWKTFMIQFLNIAGTGPIFGAIMGMWFGPAAYLWIVLGSIFAGAVHDYMSGMLSMRHDGAGLSKIAGIYLGNASRNVLLVFTLVLLILVSAVFVYSPALILSSYGGSTLLWIALIFAYYMVATVLPIDKLIGKVYPLFAASLLFMAVALGVVLVWKMPALPELWDIGNMERWTSGVLRADGSDALGIVGYMQKNPLIPCLFITIACGAISGFHATQSPIMARCVRSEREGRRVFYGSMITEGVVTLIWAAVSSYFFFYGGWKELVSPEEVERLLAATCDETLINHFSAPIMVKVVCTGWLGVVGSVLAVLGVVAATITSGDTALRSIRLIIAETFHIDQRPILKRLAICIPILPITGSLLWWQIANPDSFNAIWQYLGWSNQTLSVFTLWAITVYLVRERKFYYVTLVPALFMTAICGLFVLVSPLMLGLPNPTVVTAVAVPVVVAVALLWFELWKRRYLKNQSAEVKK